ncbi:hypothetical protein BO94DRAFT_537227 [Aspergillus sclerotioniger CBS 115572]|uniref:Uncharacterized protein n=1 Tax=Aspergillus sclerotioniger CBS 115572 TaxID=1450535 RepID=A0A317W139_9EURO|nr:hypothetical protein BO94DRAFT_537227 [Aspergillus sclerotioniger CBS 115572]PWY80356.1 hypothetical protein BO94DRAFT_537227 [Aspergillus sclerotioniger CBS 115572]
MMHACCHWFKTSGKEGQLAAGDYQYAYHSHTTIFISHLRTEEFLPHVKGSVACYL